MRITSIVGAATVFALLLGGCSTTRGALAPVWVPDETSDGAAIWSAENDEPCFAEGGNVVRRLNPPGRLTPRECVLRNLHRAGEEGRFEHVGRYADQLRGHYYLRSGRQQRFMDNGAAVTFTGALGAGLSGRVGAATQRAWLGVAFLPILLTNVNANEPTRDLFHAGALALGLISRRYDTMHVQLRTLTAIEGTEMSVAPPSCVPATGAVQQVADWAPGDDSREIMPEARRLLAGCLAVEADYNHTMLTLSALSAIERHWAADYSHDAFSLDRMLIYKDRQFRFSPAETMGAMAAAPFRTIDTFLSGQDTTEALKTMQTVMAFENMNLELAEMHLPARREPTAAIGRLNDAARARAHAQERADGAPPTADIVEVLAILDMTAEQLGVAQSRQAYRSQLIDEFYAAAEARYLVFAFSATSGVVSVRLEQTAPEAPVESAQSSEPETANEE